MVAKPVLTSSCEAPSGQIDSLIWSQCLRESLGSFFPSDPPFLETSRSHSNIRLFSTAPARGVLFVP